MSTLNEITTLIASSLKRELDDPFKLMLADRVDYWRSTLISRSIEKNPAQANLFRTPLIVAMHGFSDPLSIPLSCKKYRSKVIPRKMRINSGKWLYVGSEDGSTAFRFAEPGQLDFLESGKFAGNTIFYEEANRQIIMKRFVPIIRIDDIFDSGIEVLKSQSTPEEDIWEMEYPVTKDILQMIVQYILEVDFGNKKAIEPTEQVEVTQTEP
jgi:hypothetical protein